MRFKSWKKLLLKDSEETVGWLVVHGDEEVVHPLELALVLVCFVGVCLKLVLYELEIWL
jgi:hypothetical protein